MFKLVDKKIITILRKLFLLNWPYGLCNRYVCFVLQASQWQEIFLRILCEVTGCPVDAQIQVKHMHTDSYFSKILYHHGLTLIDDQIDRIFYILYMLDRRNFL